MFAALSTMATYPELGALLLAAVVFIVVRSLL
jgi:hypothetical protein